MGTGNRIEIEPRLLEAVERRANARGESVEHLVDRTLLESLKDADPEAYWAVRATRARRGALLAFLATAGNETPIPGDELDPEQPRA